MGYFTRIPFTIEATLRLVIHFAFIIASHPWIPTQTNSSGSALSRTITTRSQQVGSV